MDSSQQAVQEAVAGHGAVLGHHSDPLHGITEALRALQGQVAALHVPSGSAAPLLASAPLPQEGAASPVVVGAREPQIPNPEPYSGDLEHKVIIVGLDNAGKTTILYQFLTKEAVHTSPTVGSNVEEVTVRNTHFLVWDVGGQDSLRNSWNSYFCNTEIVILVIDSTDRERLTVSKEELHRILAHEDLQQAGVLILANKQDVKGSLTVSEISQCLTLDAITSHPWHVQACCALTGEGLPASLDWMRSQVVAS